MDDWWSCTTCGIPNDPRYETCVSCGTKGSARLVSSPSNYQRFAGGAALGARKSASPSPGRNTIRSPSPTSSWVHKNIVSSQRTPLDSAPTYSHSPGTRTTGEVYRPRKHAASAVSMRDALASSLLNALLVRPSHREVTDAPKHVATRDITPRAHSSTPTAVVNLQGRYTSRQQLRRLADDGEEIPFTQTLVTTDDVHQESLSRSTVLHSSSPLRSKASLFSASSLPRKSAAQVHLSQEAPRLPVTAESIVAARDKEIDVLQREVSHWKREVESVQRQCSHLALEVQGKATELMAATNSVERLTRERNARVPLIVVEELNLRLNAALDARGETVQLLSSALRLLNSTVSDARAMGQLKAAVSEATLQHSSVLQELRGQIVALEEEVARLRHHQSPNDNGGESLRRD